jgi:hypothetical protein
VAEVSYYLDEHVPRAVARALRARRIDALTVAEAGSLGAPDVVHLVRALREGRVLVTQDDDFLRLAAGGERHAGIVYVPPDRSIGTVVRGLALIHAVLSAEEMHGQIEYL